MHAAHPFYFDMRILHFIYDHMKNPWVGGGGAVRVYELSRRLALKGHTVDIVSGRYPGAVDYSEGNLSYLFLGKPDNYMKSTFSYAWEAARYVRRKGKEYDIVIEDFAPWNPIFSRFLTNRPAVLHLNHKERIGIVKRRKIMGIPFYLIESVYPSLFKYVTALSEGTKEKIGRKDVVVLPAGINKEAFGPGGQRIEEDFILYAGRLAIKNKGLDTLFSAMKGIDANLKLIGRGRDEAELKEMARAGGAENIEFLGYVSEDEKLSMMRRAKIFVLPSRFEGWGIVVLEAGASGAPVIVSDIEELSFAVKGGFGVSFKTADEDDLRQKLKELLSDNETRLRMSARAVEFARDYEWDGIARMYEDYLMGILKGETKGSG